MRPIKWPIQMIGFALMASLSCACGVKFEKADWEIVSLPEALCHVSCTMLNPTCYTAPPPTTNIHLTNVMLNDVPLENMELPDLIHMAANPPFTVSGHARGSGSTSLTINVCYPIRGPIATNTISIDLVDMDFAVTANADGYPAADLCIDGNSTRVTYNELDFNLGWVDDVAPPAVRPFVEVELKDKIEMGIEKAVYDKLIRAYLQAQPRGIYCGAAGAPGQESCQCK